MFRHDRQGEIWTSWRSAWHGGSCRLALAQIFERGEFSITVDDNTRIESIRANVDDAQTAYELLLTYLERYAEKQYLSVDEIGTRISEFYGRFADCADIGDNSTGVFERLLTRTSISNKTAYLRLLAYQNRKVSKKHIKVRAVTFQTAR